MAAHMDLGLLRQHEIVQRRQRAAVVALMHRDHALLHRGRHGKGRVFHAEALEDAFLHQLAQALAGDALGDLAGPVHVGAVFPGLARIEQHRGVDRGVGGRDDARLAVILRKTVVGLVEEIVGEARGVQKQHPRRHIAFRRAQLRLAVVVEAVDHLQLADRRRILLGRRVEIEPAVLDQLQANGAGNRFRGRKDGADAVGGHVDIAAEPALAHGAFVDIAVPVGRDRCHARHAGRGTDGLVQDRIAGGLKITHGGSPPVSPGARPQSAGRTPLRSGPNSLMV